MNDIEDEGHDDENEEINDVQKGDKENAKVYQRIETL